MRSNISRVEELLEPPASDTSLIVLRDELNALAKMKHMTRVAFCRRLAMAYTIVVGRKTSMDAPKDGGTKKFISWCDENIKSGTGKRYTRSTIITYLSDGFSDDPDFKIAQHSEAMNKKSEKNRRLGSAIQKAFITPINVFPIPKIKSTFRVASDVATEVNYLMTAWEQASYEARKLFIKLVT